MEYFSANVLFLRLFQKEYIAKLFKKSFLFKANGFQAMVTHLVQKTFERFPWKDVEAAHVLKVK